MTSHFDRLAPDPRISASKSRRSARAKAFRRLLVVMPRKGDETMLTKEQVLEAVRNGRASDCLDGRDYSRLAHFFPASELQTFGFSLKEGVDAATWEVKDWTRENILAQLKDDVAFGFEKALNKRGISAGLTHEVVLMWMWVLEETDPAIMSVDYAQYGLPLFKAVAVKYGFPNEIGDDTGTEDKYAV